MINIHILPSEQLVGITFIASNIIIASPDISIHVPKLLGIVSE